jgi:hypothetical protein
MSFEKCVKLTLVVLAFAIRSHAVSIDFNANDGTFTATTLLMNSGGNGTPWSYNTGSNCYGGGGCWIVNDYGQTSSQALTSPQFLANGPVTLMFDHSFNEEASGTTAFDGDVVEISINGGLFMDVVDSFGPFTGQTYNTTIDSHWSNPDGGRAAFGGTNPGGYGTFVTSSMVLALAGGDSFALRWVQATDNSGTSSPPNGWILDNVSLDLGSDLGSSDVPEPESFGLIAIGIGAIVLGRARRK